MRYADHGIDVAKCPSQQFVCKNARRIVKSKQTVVREDGTDTHQMGV